MKITNGYEDGPRTACLLPRQQAFRAATAGAGSHSMEARILSYQGFSDVYLKRHRIMLCSPLASLAALTSSERVTTIQNGTPSRVGSYL